MALLKGNNVSTPVTTFAPLAAPSVAPRAQYVDLGTAVQQEMSHAQESVRIAARLFAYLFRSHTSRSLGCLGTLSDCCPNVGCCPFGQVSACTLPTTW